MTASAALRTKLKKRGSDKTEPLFTNAGQIIFRLDLQTGSNCPAYTAVIFRPILHGLILRKAFVFRQSFRLNFHCFGLCLGRNQLLLRLFLNAFGVVYCLLSLLLGNNLVFDRSLKLIRIIYIDKLKSYILKKRLSKRSCKPATTSTLALSLFATSSCACHLPITSLRTSFKLGRIALAS